MKRWGVVLAARDAERTVAAAVASLLQQSSESDLDVVVVSDGSRDRTAAVARKVLGRRGRVLELPASTGRAGARNLAAAELDTAFLVIADADDVSLPGRIAAHEELLETVPDAVAVAGQAVVRNARGVAYGVTRSPTDFDEISAYLAAGMMPVIHPASAVRRDSFMRIGGYDDRFTRAQDFHLFGRLRAMGPIVASSAPVIAYTRPIVLPRRRFNEERAYARYAFAALTDEDLGARELREWYPSARDWVIHNVRHAVRAVLDNTSRSARRDAVRTARRDLQAWEKVVGRASSQG